MIPGPTAPTSSFPLQHRPERTPSPLVFRNEEDISVRCSTKKITLPAKPAEEQQYEILKVQCIKGLKSYRYPALDENKDIEKPSVPFDRHVLLRNLCEKIDFFSADDMVSAFDKWLSRDKGLDEICELLTCPLTMLRLQDPVLLNSGHTVERSAILKWTEERGRWATNPFTREQIEYEDDIMTLQFIHVLDAFFASKLTNTVQARDTIDQLCESPFVVEDPVRWCRLLSVVMKPGRFFVRAKGRNHFVLEARLPIQRHVESSSRKSADQKVGYSVLRVSFFVNKNGKYQLFGNVNRDFDTLEKVFEHRGYNEFKPLSKKEREKIEDTLGKEAFLHNTCHTQEDSLKRSRLLHVIDLLERRYDDTEIYQIERRYPNSVLVRAGVSSTSRPSFTAMMFDPETKDEYAKKITLVNGDLYVLTAMSFERRGDECRFKIIDENGKVSKKSKEELDPEDPLEGRILEEWNAIHDQLPENENVERKLFILPDNPESFWKCDIMSGGELYSEPVEKRTTDDDIYLGIYGELPSP